MKRKQLYLLLVASLIGINVEAGPRIPYYEMTPTTNIPSSVGAPLITDWRSISQVADNDSSNDLRTGFVGNLNATGIMSFEFANLYDVDGMMLWNDVAVDATGLRKFSLKFYDAQNALIGTSSTFNAVSQVAAQNYSFPTYKNVKRVDVVISQSVYADVREIAFTGTRSPVSDITPEIANDPIPLDNRAKPNVLVIMDNSQSMDALMSGSLVSGNFRDDKGNTTRSNIGRRAIRNSMVKYQNKFNWGLMSFDLVNSSLTLRNTYVYLMGRDATMNFTDTCVGYVAGRANGAPLKPGLSGGKSCVANPQDSVAKVGDKYITYELSSDDPKVLDALYFETYLTTPFSPQYWWIARNCTTPYTTYDWWTSRNTTTPTLGWTDGSPKTTNCSASNTNRYYVNKNDAMKNPNFFDATKPNGNRKGASSPSATDAGFVAGNFAPNYVSRMLFLPRGWGYQANITGSGKLNEDIQINSADHMGRLLQALAYETPYIGSAEIKNAAIYTATTGALTSAKTHFPSVRSKTPWCASNAVVLVTDGLPTGKTDGTIYPETERVNTCFWNTSTKSCSSGALGKAATDAAGAVAALAADNVKTYVVAVADIVKNANHMAVMHNMASKGGTEQALLATDDASFSMAMEIIANNLVAREGSGGAVIMSSTNGKQYQTSYKSNYWSGDIEAYNMDDKGDSVGIRSWSAQENITAMPLSSRKIVTSPSTGGKIGGIPFQWLSLSGTQQNYLMTPNKTNPDGTSWTPSQKEQEGKAVLAYLRGDRSEEGKAYRKRSEFDTNGKPVEGTGGRLGDIVNAETVVVHKPSFSYIDAGYSNFKKTNRLPMLYQAANDGMLHAITADKGEEAWAFVPNMVIKDLNNLSRPAGAFVHKPYVDATPEVGDVDFGKMYIDSESDTAWRSILVGGLGKGGRGYYALNVTTSSATSEISADIKDPNIAVNKVLWEFPNSISNAATRKIVSESVGYTFGKPVIAKIRGTKISPTSTKDSSWVVLAASGYNNGNDTGGNGLGYLYVINAKTGDLIKAIPTDTCHNGDMRAKPCGLTHITGYAVNPATDNTVQYVYGGDLYGNVWRFDLSGGIVSDMKASKMALLTDDVGNTQPITTKPQTATVEVNGKKLVYVYVGTGRYLGANDVVDKQKQSIYGLIDRSGSKTVMRSNLLMQTLTPLKGNSKKREASAHEMNFLDKDGWYADLQDKGERINTTPIVNPEFGIVAFISNVPRAEECNPGGYAWLNILEYLSGGFANTMLMESSELIEDDIGVGLAALEVPGTDGGPKTLVLKAGGSKKTLTSKQVTNLPARKVSWKEITQ